MALTEEEKSKIKPKRNTREISWDTRLAEIAQRMTAAGANGPDLAYLLGDWSLSTLNRMKKAYPELKRCINRGKELSRAQLIAGSFRRALGYEIEEIVYNWDGNEWKNAKKTTKHIPGDPAILKWLIICLDRQLHGKDWSDIKQVEEDRYVHLLNDKESVPAQIEKLAGKLSEFLPKKIENVST